MATILVVDDEEVFRTMLSELLTEAGHAVRLAINGEEGMAAAATGPDLVIMDMGMPGMTGFEAIRRLKADPATKDIPILAVTAADTQADYDELVELGCDRYLPKPITAESLMTRVDDLLNG